MFGEHHCGTLKQMHAILVVYFTKVLKIILFTIKFNFGSIIKWTENTFWFVAVKWQNVKQLRGNCFKVVLYGCDSVCFGITI